MTQAFVYAAQQKPSVGTVVGVGPVSLSVQVGATVLPSVPVAPPLTMSQVLVGDVVALAWVGERPFATAVLNQEASTRETEAAAAAGDTQVVYVSGGGGGGAQSHSDLLDLTVDTHPQYPNITSGEEIIGLWEFVGAVDFVGQSTPANPASGTRRLFVDSGTGELSVRTSGGSTISLEGVVPTGTGFRHVTSGVEDAAAKLVENDDVDASAAIAESKLNLNYPTHAQQHSITSGSDHTIGGNDLDVVGNDSGSLALLTPSSSPAGAALLRSNASGHLQLVGLGIGASPAAGNVVLAASGKLVISDAALVRGGTNILSPDSGDSLRSTSYTSGLIGWNIAASGDAEFSNVRIRGELSSAVFKYNELAATAGTLGIFKSASKLAASCTTVTSPTTFTLSAENSDAGGALFAASDILRLRSWTGAVVSDNWVSVSSVGTNHGSYTDYTCVLESGSTATFQAGTAVVNYGQSGEGFIALSADGVVGTSPNITLATHAGSPWSAFTSYMRAGNLNGSYGISSTTYGVGIGRYGEASQSSIRLTSGTITMFNNTTAMIILNSDGLIRVGPLGAGLSNVLINSGSLTIRTNATERIKLSGTGVLSINDSGGNPVFTFDASAGAEFTKPLTIATTGGIYQGTGTFASPTTGLKIWNDSGVGRIAGYNGGTAQWYVDTDGKLYAGGGSIRMTQYGIRGYDGSNERWRLWNDGSGWLGGSDIFAWGTDGIVAFKADGLVSPWLMPSLSDALTWPNENGGGKLMYAWKPIGEELEYGPVALGEISIADTDYSATSQGGPYVALDGSNDYLYTGSSLWPQLESNLYLFWIWVNATTLTGVHSIAGVWKIQDNAKSWIVRWNSSSGAFEFLVSSDGSTNTTVTSTYSESTGNWYFIAAYYQPSTLTRIWVGSESDTSLTINSNTTSIPSSVYDGRSTAQFRIGCCVNSSGNSDYFWNGKIGCFGGWKGVPSSSVNGFVESIWKRTRAFYE